MPQSPKQTAAFNERLDHFAELLSQGIEIPEIRQRMGLSRNHPYHLLDALRAKLGWQAR